jgi:hypothetical protein
LLLCSIDPVAFEVFGCGWQGIGSQLESTAIARFVLIVCRLGLRCTSVIGDQLRVGPDQRSGLSRLAFS